MQQHEMLFFGGGVFCSEMYEGTSVMGDCTFPYVSMFLAQETEYWSEWQGDRHKHLTVGFI